MDISKSVTLSSKRAGDFVYVIGETFAELVCLECFIFSNNDQNDSSNFSRGKEAPRGSPNGKWGHEGIDLI